MKKLVLSGYYGFGNAGDEALLASIIEALRDAVPQCEITVISGNPKRTAKEHAVRAVYIFNVVSLLKTIYNSDLLISGGGSLLQNVTSRRSIYYYLFVIFLGKLFSKAVMLYAQGIGPIRGNLPRRLLKYVVNKVDYITVRDEGSFYELRGEGINRPQIEITADAVLGMKAVATDKGRDSLINLGLSLARPIVAIAPRRWGQGNYLKAFAEAADLAYENSNADILFLPLHTPQDNRVCEEIRALMRNKAYIFPGDCSAEMHMSVLGNCQLLIGVRLHALIFAAIMSKPVVGVSYDPKIDRFMHSLGLKSSADIRSLNGLRLYQDLFFALNNSKELSEQVDVHMTGIRNRALRSAEVAARLLHKGKEDDKI